MEGSKKRRFLSLWTLLMVLSLTTGLSISSLASGDGRITIK